MTASPPLLPLRIRLPYATEEEFIGQYGANVARGGVFVATRAPKPEGTGLSFEFVLADGSRVLRGEGVVVKSQLDTSGGRAGMTVRFTRLDARSKAFVDRVVARRQQEQAQEPPREEPSYSVEEAFTPAPLPGRGTSAAPPPGLVRRAPPKPAAPSTVPPNLTGKRATPPRDTAPAASPSTPPAAEAPSAAEPTPAPLAPAPPEPTPQPAPAPLASEPPEPPASAPPELAPTPSAEEVRRTLEARNRRRVLLDVPEPSPASAPLPEVVLGIDLGTTRSRAAVFHEGRAQLIPIGDAGTQGLASVLAVGEGGQLLVGEAALAEAARNPRHAVLGFKRLVGLRLRSPQTQAIEGLLPFSVVADARGEATVELRGQLVPPSEFPTLLLRELKAAASGLLGREVTRAVLCVPAWFNERQRAAVREAGTRAGLTVQRLLNAPAAAALSYGHGRGLARKRVLVVDLGGGGLEVAVVQVTGDDLEVITTGADATLGGMEFDARLAELLASARQEQGAPRPEHPLDWAPLLRAAEATKVALSELDEAPVPLASPALPPLQRERLEALTADLAQRVAGVVREVLDSCALSPQGLDEVLLVGGQGRTPLVRQRLEESLGVPVRLEVDGSGAAALGAALLGHHMLEAEAGKPAGGISEVLTLPLGVAERGGGLRRVLERNTRLPADKTLVLPVAAGPLSLALFQGPSLLAAENELLGVLEFAVERPGEAELHFSLSVDGTLSLAATLPGGRRQPVALCSEDLDDAALQALLARSPLSGEAEARPAGLLSGLRKLFGRR